MPKAKNWPPRTPALLLR